MIMINLYCPLSLLVLLLLIQGTESFVSSSVVTHQVPPIPIHQQKASSSGLDSLLGVASSLQLAEDGPDSASLIGDSVLKYPLGVLAVSLISLVVTYVAEQVALAVEKGGGDEEEINKKDDTTQKKTKIVPLDEPEEKPMKVEDTTSLDQWSD